MNVCMVAYSYYQTDHRIINYAESLVERGCRVDFIGLKKATKTKRFMRLKGVDLYSIQSRNHNEQSIFSYLYKMMTFFLIGCLFLLWQHLRRSYRIIHIHNVPDWLVFMAFLPKLLGAKVILDIHDIFPEFYCQKFNKSSDSFLAQLALKVEKLSVSFADYVIVANDLWVKKLRSRSKKSPHKFCAILNYPRWELIKKSVPHATKKYFTIVYPGTISHLHGVDIAIKAMPLVTKKIPQARLHIYGLAGNADYYQELHALIEKLNLNGKVELFEPVHHEELAKIYENAYIGVVPKRNGIFSSEAFSTKIFDFMAAGLPVVASRTKIDLHYFDDSMIMFFEPENHMDLAKCIVNLYKDKKTRESLVKQSRQFLAQNNWSVRKKEYYRIVDQLAG